MKKLLSISFIGVVTAMLLTSCGFQTSLEFEEYNQYIEKIDTKKEINEPNYYKLGAYEPLEYLNYDKTHKTINSLRDIFSSNVDGANYINMPSSGEINLLVLPITFSDSDNSALDEQKIYIQNAFFGTKEKTTGESVASYYNHSSYGQLKLKGFVNDFYSLDKTGAYYQKLGIRTKVSRYLTSLAVENYKKTHDDIAKYDNDKDGFIDGVVTIYNYPKSSEVESLFWAYADSMSKDSKINIDGETILYNQSEPYVSMYGWMSNDFMEVNNNYVNARTYIHEIGHFLGLKDYYSDSYFQPLGRSDMMDYNIGDHNIFSKMLLDWTTPIVITDNATIKIRPSVESGDCIIIPSPSIAGEPDWNKTPYDEMLVIEFYSPFGINQSDKDIYFKYQNVKNETKEGRLLSNYGIKVYHVDSRLAFLKEKHTTSYVGLFGDPNLESIVDEYLKQAPSKHQPTELVVDFPFTNRVTSHPYIRLMESRGAKTFELGENATNETLFKKGMDFGITCYENFTFYDGTSLPFNFKIKDIKANYAEIEFIKR